MGQIINRKDINSHLHGYQKVVTTNGCFDILTVGHKRLLEYARSLGDVLIVCINSDSSTRRIKGPGRRRFTSRATSLPSRISWNIK
jgi:cytidyltransferase-like protein